MWEPPWHSSSEVSSATTLKTASMPKPPHTSMIHTRLAEWGPSLMGLCPCNHVQHPLSCLEDGGWDPRPCCAATACLTCGRGEREVVTPMLNGPTCVPSQWILIPPSHTQVDTRAWCNKVWLPGRGPQCWHEGRGMSQLACMHTHGLLAKTGHFGHTQHTHSCSSAHDSPKQTCSTRCGLPTVLDSMSIR